MMLALMEYIFRLSSLLFAGVSVVEKKSLVTGLLSGERFVWDDGGDSNYDIWIGGYEHLVGIEGMAHMQSLHNAW